MATTTDGAHAGEEFRMRSRGALSPAQVRALSKLSPSRATASLVATFGLAAGAIAVALRWRNPFVVAAAVAAVAAAQHGLAILAHQSAHYRMFETRWLNDLVGRMCGTPLGVSMITYRVIHRIHHNHLYEPIDPDLALMAGYPRGRAYLVRKLLKDLTGLTTLKNYVYFFGKPPTEARHAAGVAGEALDDTSPALRASARRDRIAVVAVHLVMVPMLIATGAWRAYLVLWLLPLATVLQALLRLRAVCEHGAPRHTRDVFHAARTTLASPWVRWILFPHGMNFHIEHHLYPSVPHYRLAACHEALRMAGALDDAEVVPRLASTLGRVFAAPRSDGNTDFVRPSRA